MKVESPALSAAAKFTEQEDVYLCKAFVNCSSDPIVGVNQKGDTFWKKVHEKMYALYNEEADVVVQERSWTSVRNRFQKTIQKSINLFNGYHVQVQAKEESGWTPQMYIDAAVNLYATMEGKAFKLEHVIRILHQLPKFKPGAIDDEDGDKKMAANPNPIGNVMGGDLERPMGNKAAKLQRRQLGNESVASTANFSAISAVARSSNSIMLSWQRDRSMTVY